MASSTNDGLTVHYPLSNGRYLLSLGMQRRVTIDFGQKHCELSQRGIADFGEINVADEVFRATIRLQGDEPVGLPYFGFIPPAAFGVDQGAMNKQLERLRSLAFVD